jgi:Immunity protein 35
MFSRELAAQKMEGFLRTMEAKAKRFNSYKYLPDIKIGPKEVRGNDDDKLKLAVSSVEENEYCWRFYYTSKIFLDTCHPDYGLIGNNPIIIDKENGNMYGTRIDYPKNYMDDFKDYKTNNQFEYDWESLKVD